MFWQICIKCLLSNSYCAGDKVVTNTDAIPPPSQNIPAKASLSNPWPMGYKQPRMAFNAAQHLFVTFLKTLRDFIAIFLAHHLSFMLVYIYFSLIWFYLKICTTEGGIWSFVKRNQFSQYIFGHFSFVVNNNRKGSFCLRSSLQHTQPGAWQDDTFPGLKLTANPLTQVEHKFSRHTHIHTHLICTALHRALRILNFKVGKNMKGFLNLLSVTHPTTF